jgi:regulator of protease activity HflC (stomatin/prohibitin superfamily)
VVALLVILIILGFILVFFGLTGLRVVQEYERAVIFYLGRCQGAKGPGLFYVPPLISRIVKVNLQTQAVPVASQQVITKDNVTVAVDAVAYFRVRDPVADQDPELVQRRAARRADVAAVDHRPARARPAAR